MCVMQCGCQQDGMDFIGPYYFDIDQAVSILRGLDNIENYVPEYKWTSFDDTCYFLYDDGKSKVEIELNAGTKDEKADQISVRTNIFKNESNIRITIGICRTLSEKLNLRCWNMKLRSLIDFYNEESVNKSISNFEALRNK